MDQKYTYEELKKKQVEQLREIAATMEHEAVQGYTQLNKEHLLTAICTALNIDMHAHHVVIGLEKTAVKTKIKGLKKKRDGLLTTHDYKQLKTNRRHRHALKRRLRKAMV